MAEKNENKPVEYSECPKCRKHGYYKSNEFYACRECGYTAPDTKGKAVFEKATDKLNHGMTSGGLRY